MIAPEQYVMSASRLLASLGWDIDDFCAGVKKVSTQLLKETLAKLRDPEDEGPEAYEKAGMPHYAARSRMGALVIETELRKCGEL